METLATSPYVGRVVDLVNPYLTPAPGLEGGYAARQAGGRDVTGWLDANPGRWALIFENGMGTSTNMLKRMGYITSERDKNTSYMRVYAQLPHPEAETLSEALARTPERKLYLPTLGKDPFDWTPDELAEACQIARDNLFPVDGRWNAKKKRRR